MAKSFRNMSTTEIAAIIKSLPRKSTHERENIEDSVGTLIFHSGLISYSEAPVEDAVKALRRFISENQTAGAQEFDPSGSEKSIAWANELISKLSE